MKLKSNYHRVLTFCQVYLALSCIACGDGLASLRTLDGWVRHIPDTAFANPQTTGTKYGYVLTCLCTQHRGESRTRGRQLNPLPTVARTHSAPLHRTTPHPQPRGTPPFLSKTDTMSATWDSAAPALYNSRDMEDRVLELLKVGSDNVGHRHPRRRTRQNSLAHV